MVAVRRVSNAGKGRDGSQQRFPMWFLFHLALVFACFACSEEEASGCALYFLYGGAADEITYKRNCLALLPVIHSNTSRVAN
jgi:hypothetical protein